MSMCKKSIGNSSSNPDDESSRKNFYIPPIIDTHAKPDGGGVIRTQQMVEKLLS